MPCTDRDSSCHILLKPAHAFQPSSDTIGRYEENLALRKWATFTKDKVFAIEKTQVVLHYEVNIGLCKYYEYILKRYDDAERYKNKDGDELKVNDDNIEVKEQKTTLEESDMEELIDEYQNVPYDYDETKH